MTAPVDKIRALPRDQREAFYARLPHGALAAVRYDPFFWARDEQAELLRAQPLQLLEIITGGRRSGKTWVAAQLFNREVLSGRARTLYPRLVAATAADMYKLINGPAGIRTWCPPEHRPTYFDSKGHSGILVYDSMETEVQCLSAERPSQAIGDGSGLTLFDDPAKAIDQCGEDRAKDMFKQIRISNSNGRHPTIILPTTPRGNAFLRVALTPGELQEARITYVGATDQNTNIAPKHRASLADIEAEDPGEFDGILRDEAPGALWKRMWINATRVQAAPDLAQVVVAIDPSEDNKASSDETGIVVVGLGHDGRLYVLADYTARHPVEIWPALVAWAFKHHGANAIVAEMNTGAAMVRRCLAIEAPNIPLVEVTATRSKQTRAEPLALMYRDGRVSHVAGGPQIARAESIPLLLEVFQPTSGRREPTMVAVARDSRRHRTLEDELCRWEPRRGRSPNGLDALVWGAWYLLPPEGGMPWPTEIQPSILPGRYAGADPRRFIRGRARS